ncbi:MAG TPA: bifunctional diaminohydroxyphosphoribosylaminopyrimidine deaminase/5-amino-6-(5-phosphoribosylamino)uracil reductase RibD [Planctomycetota bacterium]|jgi:diaminohydroxyphosphoribosylaminopyrimidine deaminase/5-amino-6-(5-phosphoribosylamino)uracil reductase|nr:bifunctional diaminohydroxyphosphoribosylaminopyrimidine deaminase/5-amino-6-(5-phosphoribosylamino)uracil reductase RibD [Planctomycetota bacterium]
MRRAIELARGGAGKVEPNPRVGAVLLRRGRIVAEGFHEAYGGPHAEVAALRGTKGDTLVVTLEPCSTRGKTSACTEAIRRRGVRRVVWALDDPGPENGGKAQAILEGAGVEVVRGVARREAAPLLRWFRRALALERPWVVAKWAMTLDGKIASREGDSRWVSGEAARAAVHELRGRCEALAVGVGTVLADDPLLTPRGRSRLSSPPLRIVFDSRLRTRPEARLFSDRSSPVVIATGREADPERERALRQRGAEVLRFGVDGEGRVEVTEVLRVLRQGGVRRLLLESGGALAASFFAAGAVDQVIAFVAPKVAGGAGAPTPVGGAGVARMAQALPAAEWFEDRVGEDLQVVAFLGEGAALPGGA